MRIDRLARVRRSIARHAAGEVAYVHGSVIVPGGYRDTSDVDVAFEPIVGAAWLDRLQSVLSREVGCEVDVMELSDSPLSAKVRRQGVRVVTR